MGAHYLRRTYRHLIRRSAPYIFGALLAFVNPCGALEKLTFEVSRSDSASFELVDGRNGEERMSRQPSDIQVVLGDEQFEPSPVGVLRALLQKNLGDRLSGKSLKLTKFEVSIFSQRKWGRGSSNPMFGVLIPAIVDALGARTNVVCRVWVILDGKEHEGLSFVDDVGGNKEDALRQVVVNSIDALAKSIGLGIASSSNLSPDRTH